MNEIFLYLSGSRAYGFSNPESDYDYRGVFIAPRQSLFDLGFASQRESKESKDGKNGEKVLFEIRKLFQLMCDNNPNTIEFLFVPDDCILSTSDLWNQVIKKRSIFLSKKVRYSFSGYAIAQMKRIRTHRRYLLDPPNHQPTRSEFGLPEYSTIPKEYRSAILTIPDEFLSEGIKDSARRELQFLETTNKWNSYQEWLVKRNPARREIEKKHGYDCKHATHLVRLCRQAEELLTTGEMFVRRPDADELLQIRQGAWSYEQLEEYARQIDFSLQEVYDKSTLPYSPDTKASKDLLAHLLSEHYNIDLESDYGK